MPLSDLPGTSEPVEQRIRIVRGQRVILSPDLASLYEVDLRVLTRAVKRKAERFPADFMFQLSEQEFAEWKIGSGATTRAVPHAFTGSGVAMLAAVLNSPRAVEMSLEIMRAFVKLRAATSRQS